MPSPVPSSPAEPAETTSDLRVTSFQPLIPPADLRAELPLGEKRAAMVLDSREPYATCSPAPTTGCCSSSDRARSTTRRPPSNTRTGWPQRAADTATTLCVVMRVYFEKPRTTVGWKGLINDPGMDGTHDVPGDCGWPARFCSTSSTLGLPIGCEFLEPTTPAVHRRRGVLGRHRGPHAGEPSSPAARRRACRCRSASRTPPTATSRPPWTVAGRRPVRRCFFGIDERWPRRGRLHRRQPRLPHHPARRAHRTRTTIPKRAGRAGPGDEGGKAGAPDHRRQPRQQRQGPHPPGGSSSARWRRRSRPGTPASPGMMLESFLVPGRQEPGPLGRADATGRA